MAALLGPSIRGLRAGEVAAFSKQHAHWNAAAACPRASARR
jgi:hypothetical protein